MKDADVNFICPYAHLIQSTRCACHYASRYCIAEKEWTSCLNKNASCDCVNLYQNLSANSKFIFHSHHQKVLSIGQQNKVKMGGLLALQDLISGIKNARVADINLLVSAVKKRYGDFEKLPFLKIIPTISTFQFRKSRH